MTDVKSLLVRVLDHAGSSGTFSALTVFPLKTIEEMDKAEDQLRSEEFFEKYANVISRLGGSSEAKIVNNICSYVFHHALAQQIRLTASSGKRAIDNTKLLALICESARRTGLGPLQTNTNIRKFVGTWFRGACDRLGGRQNRIKHGNVSKVTAEKLDSNINEFIS